MHMLAFKGPQVSKILIHILAIGFGSGFVFHLLSVWGPECAPGSQWTTPSMEIKPGHQAWWQVANVLISSLSSPVKLELGIQC